MLPNSKICCILGLLLLPCLPLFAQDYTLEEVLPLHQVEDTELEGLIYDIYQDDRGFLWFATQAGLYKYDGFQTTLYEHDPNDPASISGDWIGSIDSDAQGNLWIAVFGGGLDKFDPNTERFYHHQHDPDDESSLVNNRVGKVLLDRDGRVWACTQEGLSRLDTTTNTFKNWNSFKDPNLPNLSNDVRSGLYDHSGNLWFNLGNGLGLFHPEQDSFSFFRPPSFRGWIRDYLLEDSGSMLLFGHNCFWRFDLKNRSWEKLDSEANSGIHDMLRIDKDTYLASTQNGLAYYYPSHQKWHPIKLDASFQEIFLSESVALLQDAAGNILIGGNGLIKLSRNQNAIQYYQISTLEGKAAAFSTWGDQNPYYNSFYALRDNRIGIGKQLIFNVEGQTIQNLPEVFPKWELEERFLDICRDHEDNLWRASVSRAGIRIDSLGPTDEGDMRTYLIKDLWLGGIFTGQIDRAHNFWMGTWGGLYKYHLWSGTLKKYTYDPKDPGSLASNAVRTIFVDKDGQLWAGTDGGGLNWVRALLSFLLYL